MAHLAALVRLAHPLPTLLNALVAAALTTTAGGSSTQAALAAITMLGIHASIGAMNDLLDQERDKGRSEKPLVGGNVSPQEARVMVIIAATAGFAAASALSSMSVSIAAAGATLGYLYNAGIKRTPISFLPFALGVALIPACAWSAAGVPLPAAIATLCLIALPGGSALALQNALADRELDKSVGANGAVVRLGHRRTILLIALLHGFTYFLLLVSAPVTASPVLLAVGGLLLVAGVTLSTRLPRALRQRGWEVSALALACCAIAISLSYD
jgi:4-hydroxybenzoate polyprenyltransferase